MPTAIDRPSYRLLLLAPIVMSLYQAMTVIAFRFGPWPWPVTNPGSLYGYLTLAVLCFFVCSVVAAIVPLPWRSPFSQPKEARLVSWAIWLMIATAIMLSISRTGSPIPSWPTNSHETVENYSRFVQRNTIRGWWTYLEYGAAILTPAFIIGLVGAPLYWSKIGRFLKFLYVAALAIYLLTYISIGVNRGLFQIIVLLPLTFGLYFLGAKRISRRTALVFSAIAVAGLLIFVLGLSYLLSYRDPNTGAGYFLPLEINAVRSGIVYKILPPSLFSTYENITRYMVNGYYGLSLALQETDYRLGYGLTSSMLVLRKANAALGDQWYFQTLLPLIEQKYNWSMWTLWHSAYTWFISDFGIAGSLGVVGAIGALYGLTWRNLLATGSVVPLALFYLLNMMIFYLSGNNQIFQTADLFVAFVVILLIFLSGYIRLGSRLRPFLVPVADLMRRRYSTLRLASRPIYIAAGVLLFGSALALFFGVHTSVSNREAPNFARIEIKPSATLDAESALARAASLAKNDRTERCSNRAAAVLEGPFERYGAEKSYRITLPAIDHIADNSTTPFRSPLLLCEDGKSLGPSHTAHAAITTLGSGRYSHWSTDGLIFSASDNTDPNTNGRVYSIALDLQVPPTPEAKTTAAVAEPGPQTTCDNRQAKALQAPFNRFGNGHAYNVVLPGFEYVADSTEHPKRSTLVICEDGKLLGPAHNLHSEIIELGNGRFSHWSKSGVIFAASDNTDPNQNGRVYLVTLDLSAVAKTTDTTAGAKVPVKTDGPPMICGGHPASKIDGPFARFGDGNGYKFPAPDLEQISDNSEKSQQSPLLLCEDGKMLGPPHSSHPEITTAGNGRFSHWSKLGVIFAASDNTDPNKNGRTYSIAVPQ